MLTPVFKMKSIEVQFQASTVCNFLCLLMAVLTLFLLCFSGSYRQDHPNSLSGGGFSGPEPGGFPGLGESRGMGGGESRSRGRGGFDRGVMNRGGGRGGLGRGGMG